MVVVAFVVVVAGVVVVVAVVVVVDADVGVVFALLEQAATVMQATVAAANIFFMDKDYRSVQGVVGRFARQ